LFLYFFVFFVFFVFFPPLCLVLQGIFLFSLTGIWWIAVPVRRWSVAQMLHVLWGWVCRSGCWREWQHCRGIDLHPLLRLRLNGRTKIE
jgi:hypothetical protein